MAEWMKGCGIRTVAMESTGVFWIPVCQILEAKGIEVFLVNARHAKNVSGRKRHAGLPMAAAAAQLRVVIRFISAGGGDRGAAELSTSPTDVDRLRGRACPTHAKSNDLDEFATPPCDFQYHGMDGYADYSRHRRRPARPSPAGG